MHGRGAGPVPAGTLSVGERTEGEMPRYEEVSPNLFQKKDFTYSNGDSSIPRKLRAFSPYCTGA
jgi:hypothetical protein